jgi:hypothetical protein
MSETQEAAEAVEEQEAAASEEPAAEAPDAPEAEAAEGEAAPAEAPEAPEAEAAGDEVAPAEADEPPEPAAEADEPPEPAAEADEPDPDVVAAQEELAEEAIPTPVGPASGRQATVFICDRGHRTVAIWSTPSTCHARPTRSGGECGRALYPISELPDQVQKALNPLKASKKGSKA